MIIVGRCQRRQVHANVLKRVQTRNGMVDVSAVKHTTKQPIAKLAFSFQIHIQRTFWETDGRLLTREWPTSASQNTC